MTALVDSTSWHQDRDPADTMSMGPGHLARLKPVIKWEIQTLLDKLSEAGEDTLVFTTDAATTPQNFMASRKARQFWKDTDLSPLTERFRNFCQGLAGKKGKQNRSLINRSLINRTDGASGESWDERSSDHPPVNAREKKDVNQQEEDATEMDEESCLEPADSSSAMATQFDSHTVSVVHSNPEGKSHSPVKRNENRNKIEDPVLAKQISQILAQNSTGPGNYEIRFEGEGHSEKDVVFVAYSGTEGQGQPKVNILNIISGQSGKSGEALLSTLAGSQGNSGEEPLSVAMETSVSSTGYGILMNDSELDDTYQCLKQDWDTTTGDQGEDSDPGNLTCDVCSKSFNNKNSLAQHLNRKHGKGKFVCSICRVPFIWREELKKHRLHCEQTGKSEKNKSRVCEICQQVFTNATTYFKHKKRHHSAKIYSCGICGKGFGYGVDFKRHLKTHNCEGKTYYCNPCRQSFKCSESYKSHYRRDHLKQNFVCTVCGAGYTTQYRLKKHEVFHVGETEVKQEVVDEDSTESKDEEKEGASKKTGLKSQRFNCKQCGTFCSNYYRLEQHLARKHGKKLFYCDVCGNEFSMHYDCKRHVKFIHGVADEEVLDLVQPITEGAQTDGTDGQGSQESTGTSPELTGKSITGKRRTRRKREEIQAVVSGLKSSSNSQGADNQGSLVDDEGFLKTTCIQETTPFNCNSCQKSYACMLSLERHKSFAHGPRTFQCDVCKKRFSQEELLQKHKNWHGVQRPRAVPSRTCNVCNKEFKTSGAMFKHRLRNHGPKIHVCEYCGKGYSLRYVLTKHLELHNKNK